MSKLLFCPTNSKVDENLDFTIESILSGDLSIDDALEMLVDETSTASSVGNGVDMPLGCKLQNPMDKLQKRYEDYLARTRKKSSSKTVNEFVESTSPDVNDNFIRRFKTHLIFRGFNI